MKYPSKSKLRLQTDYRELETSREYSTWLEHSLDHSGEAQPDGDLEVLREGSVEDMLDVYECIQLIHRVWPPDLAGSKVGAFELITELGQGGMGTVWEAVQNEPVHRRVAIKFINSKAINPKRIQRFEEEQQVLANLNHANIARFVDAGITEAGQHYYAMELVDGENIISYCNAHGLPVNQRIELFLNICDAILHAHQNGIIHRDIKPSNVLVASIDDKPVVKVIDFGLAKLVTDNESADESTTSSDSSQQNHDRNAIGTVWYMSPEQTGQTEHSVDIRTDIYALGVLLQELITGKVWLDKGEYKSTREIVDAICHQPPLRPSDLLVDLPEESAKSIEQHQQTTIKKHVNLLRADLDWVILKAINKQPGDRYSSVSELTSDLQRFLEKRPLEARPKSRLYVVKKAIARNPVISTTVCALLATVGIGLAVVSNAYQRVSAAEQLAQQRLAQAQGSIEILGDVFNDLNIDSIENSDRPLRIQMSDRLAEAGGQVNLLTDTRSIVQLQTRLCNALISLGFPKKAIPLAEVAYRSANADLGLKDKSTRGLGRTLATAHLNAGNVIRSQELLAPILAYCEQTLGNKHPETLISQFQIAEQLKWSGDFVNASRLYADVAKDMETVFGPNDFRTLEAMAGLATILIIDREGEEAVKLLTTYSQRCEKALTKGHPKTIDALSKLAWAHCQTSNSKPSYQLASRAYHLAVESFGEHHAVAFEALKFRAISEFIAGETRQAFESIKTSIDGLSRCLGENHPCTINSRRTYIQFLSSTDAGSQRIHQLETIAGQIPAMQVDSISMASLLAELAEKLMQLGDYKNARATLSKSLEIATSHGAPERIRYASLIGETFYEEGRFSEALQSFRQAKENSESTLGPTHFQTTIAIADVAKALSMQGDTQQAADLLRQHQDQLASAPPSNPIQQLIAKSQLGIVLRYHGEIEQSVQMMQSVLDEGVRFKKMNYLRAELRKGYAQLGNDKAIRTLIESETGDFIPAGNPHVLVHQAKLRIDLSESLLTIDQDELAGELLDTCNTLFAEHQPDCWSHYVTKLMIHACQIGPDKKVDMSSLNATRDHLIDLWDQATPRGKQRFWNVLDQISRRIEESDAGKARDWRKELAQIKADLADGQ